MRGATAAEKADLSRQLEPIQDPVRNSGTRGPGYASSRKPSRAPTQRVEPSCCAQNPQPLAGAGESGTPSAPYVRTPKRLVVNLEVVEAGRAHFATASEGPRARGMASFVAHTTNV